jgi:hypothetical protein
MGLPFGRFAPCRIVLLSYTDGQALQANGALSALEKGGVVQSQEYPVENKRRSSTSRSPISVLALACGSVSTSSAPSSRHKSTVLKQAKLINNSGYNSAERDSCKGIIFSNITQSMQLVPPPSWT